MRLLGSSPGAPERQREAKGTGTGNGNLENLFFIFKGSNDRGKQQFLYHGNLYKVIVGLQREKISPGAANLEYPWCAPPAARISPYLLPASERYMPPGHNGQRQFRATLKPPPPVSQVSPNRV
ncbi:unnamed protein product [Caretta caretta]